MFFIPQINNDINNDPRYNGLSSITYMMSSQSLKAYASSQFENEPVHNTTSSQTLTFFDLATKLSNELIFNILGHWMARQRIIVTETSPDSFYVAWTCSTDKDVFDTNILPPYLKSEYKRLRQLSWLTHQKDFDDPYNFYMSHFILSKHLFSPSPKSFTPPYPAWTALEQDISCNFDSLSPRTFPNLPYHGLEKIRLDFSAAQYFSFFNVTVPPFDWDDLYHDPLCHGAASFLKRAQHLELHFGSSYKSAHAWYDVDDEDWHTTHDDWTYGEARCRPRVCESGQVVDWILECAWHQEYLQHIPEIEITGDVQAWVKEKWHGIFARQAQLVAENEENYNDDVDGALDDGGGPHPFGVHKPDIEAISTIGLEGRDRDSYSAEEYYPPKCTCTIGCWRLVGGKVQDEGVERGWDEVERWGDRPVGDWWSDSEEEDLGVW